MLRAASERSHCLIKATTCNNYYLLYILYDINTLEVRNESWDICVLQTQPSPGGQRSGTSSIQSDSH